MSPSIGSDLQVDQLIRDIAIESRVPESEVEAVLSALGTVICLMAMRGKDKVVIDNLGVFSPSMRAPRTFVRPQDKKAYRLKARQDLRFKPSPNLLRLLNLEAPLD